MKSRAITFGLILCTPIQLGLNELVKNRGGVEDTRLEAKVRRAQKKSEAKDSLSEDRPSQGQGQECSKPRTKDRAASVFRKKKGLQKSFSGNLQFIGVARIFDWGGLNHKSRVMTSSNICLLARTRILQRERA